MYKCVHMAKKHILNSLSFVGERESTAKQANEQQQKITSKKKDK